ncbi:MAG: alpha/beta fold hydrolase [Granulosicoccus sp.]
MKPALRSRLCAALAIVAVVLVTPALADKMPVEGAELVYLSDGEGQPIVFVHGSISDHRVWEPMRETITKKHRYVAYDQRYFGEAEWPDVPERFANQTHVNDLIAFIEGLDSGPVDVVTWSYSGVIGIKAALARPDLIRALIHYEPSFSGPITSLPGAKAARSEYIGLFGPGIKAMRSDDLEAASLRLLEGVFRMPEGTAENEPERWQAIWKVNGRTLPLMFGSDNGAPVTCDDLARLDKPTLVVTGSNTIIYWTMIGEQIAQCQPNALHLVMEGVNHDGPYREPQKFAAMINDFLNLVD